MAILPTPFDDRNQAADAARDLRQPCAGMLASLALQELDRLPDTIASTVAAVQRHGTADDLAATMQALEAILCEAEDALRELYDRVVGYAVTPAGRQALAEAELAQDQPRWLADYQCPDGSVVRGIATQEGQHGRYWFVPLEAETGFLAGPSELVLGPRQDIAAYQRRLDGENLVVKVCGHNTTGGLSMETPRIVPGRALVLSGLSAQSWGDGRTRRSVIHAVATAPLQCGRLTRQPGQLLCTTRRYWDIAELPELPRTAITCRRCRALVTRLEEADPC